MEEGRRNCQSLLLLLLSPFQVIHASESAAGRRRSEILRRENSERGKDAPKILTPKTLQELCRFFSLTPPHRSGEEPRADHIFPRLQKRSRRKGRWEGLLLKGDPLINFEPPPPPSTRGAR